MRYGIRDTGWRMLSAVVVLISVLCLPTSAYGQAYPLTPGGLATTDIDTSAELAAILGDEVGTGVFVLNISPLLTTPKITTGINDANGNSVIAFSPTASAVNSITVTNAAAGNPPMISSTGSDTHIGMTLSAKGSTQNFTINAGQDLNITIGNNRSINVSKFGGSRVGVSITAGDEATNPPAVNIAALGMYRWSSTVNSYGTVDTAMGRNAPGVAEINTGTAISGTSNAGSIKALAFIPAGTATSCTGATIGTGSKSNAGFVTATTTGVSTIVITFPITAPTGWSVMCSNITNAATLIQQTAKSPTTATLIGTTASGDVIQYIAMPY